MHHEGRFMKITKLEKNLILKTKNTNTRSTPKNNVLNNWCEKVGRDPNEISRSIGIDIKRIDLADDLLEAGATEITLAVNGPSYDLTQVKEWIAWRDSKE